MKEEQTGSASDGNSVPVKKHDCVLVKFRCWDIPFTLCLKKNEPVAVYVKCKTAQGYIYLTVDKSVPNVEELMRYACEHYDVFSKLLYMSLNKHISTEPEVNPFAVQMQSAFEQFGYTFNQTVEPVPYFVVNAENTYAFIQRWCRQQYGKGRTVPAMAADLQPLYNLLFEGRDILCNRVGEFFQSTVIEPVKNDGVVHWRILYFKPRKGGKFRVKNQSLKETFGKRIFIMEADYFSLPFRVKFERKCGSKHRKNYTRIHYGYDRMVVEPGADH